MLTFSFCKHDDKAVKLPTGSRQVEFKDDIFIVCAQAGFRDVVVDMNDMPVSATAEANTS